MNRFNDCVVDTNILIHLLTQFSPENPHKEMSELCELNRDRLKYVNRKIELNGTEGYIVSSTFAFVEIANKFEMLSKDRFSYQRFRSFVRQPPEWFLIESLSLEVARNLLLVPKFNLLLENIELADAIHVSTALTRGERTVLLTSDSKLPKLNIHDITIV